MSAQHTLCGRKVEEPYQPLPPCSSLEQPQLAPREGTASPGVGVLGCYFLGVGQRDMGCPSCCSGGCGGSAACAWGAAPTTLWPPESLSRCVGALWSGHGATECRDRSGCWIAAVFPVLWNADHDKPQRINSAQSPFEAWIYSNPQ